MKRILNSLIPAALLISGILVGCSKDNPTPDPDPTPDPTPTYGAAPTLTWAANPNFDDTYLAETMDVNLVVTAAEGIETFVVDVASETLTPMLSLLGIGTSMDLINDDNAIAMLSELGVPTGDDLYGKTSVNFSLSNLIPLIYALSPEAGSKHVFTLKVTDAVGQSLTQALTFIMPEPDEPTYGAAPTLTWAANPNFDPMELAEEMNVELVVTAEEKIGTFVVEVESATLTPMLTLLGIGTSMDLINSESAISMLSELGVPTGDQLYDQTEVNFSLSNLIPLIYALGPDPGSEHKFTLKVSDQVGQTLEQTLTFYMPESTAPTITWAANPDFEEYPLSDDMEVNITVTAPEGIAGFVIDIDSPSLSSFLLSMIGLSTSMDLINGSDSVKSTLGGLGIPVGDDLKDKTEVDLDLGGLFAMLNRLASSGTTHYFTLTVTDAAGQSAAQTLTFTKE